MNEDEFYSVWHEEERRCVDEIKKLASNHPVLDIIFPSTYDACKAYWKVLLETSNVGGKKV